MFKLGRFPYKAAANIGFKSDGVLLDGKLERKCRDERPCTENHQGYWLFKRSKFAATQVVTVSRLGAVDL